MSNTVQYNNTMSSLLEISNLQVNYGSKVVLDNFSLNLPKEDIVIITGKNGSGKSTLFNTIGRYIRQYKGEIHSNGQDLLNYEPHDLYKLGIVYVPQGGLVINSITVDQHFKLATKQFSKIIALQKIEEVYQEFPALKAFSKKMVANLSGGEKQLLSFACASIMNGNLWLLDEPTAGLYKDRVILMAEYIQKKNKEDKITFLIVEHNEVFTKYLDANVIELVEGKAIKIENSALTKAPILS